MTSPGVGTLGPQAARPLPESSLPTSGECVACLLARGAPIASVGSRIA